MISALAALLSGRAATPEEEAANFLLAHEFTPPSEKVKATIREAMAELEKVGVSGIDSIFMVAALKGPEHPCEGCGGSHAGVRMVTLSSGNIDVMHAILMLGLDNAINSMGGETHKKPM